MKWRPSGASKRAKVWRLAAHVVMLNADGKKQRGLQGRVQTHCHYRHQDGCLLLHHKPSHGWAHGLGPDAWGASQLEETRLGGWGSSNTGVAQGLGPGRLGFGPSDSGLWVSGEGFLTEVASKLEAI